MLPNWIIAGAPKAGTSSLFGWLVDHPSVGGSAEKETYYFTDPGTHMFPACSFHSHGVKGYATLFAHCDPSARVVVEATPAYIYAQTALSELPRLPSDPQFIFVLREPVEQLKSLYTYFQQNWNWIPHDMSFGDFVAAAEQGTKCFRGNELASQALENADYLRHLRRWRQVCGPERIHVFLFEDMLRDKRAFMHGLARRMGIDPAFYDTYSFPSENETYQVRSQFVQDVNVRVRALVPKGPVFRALRRLYRAANTRKAPSGRVLDAGVERMLSERYLRTLDALEQEFGLDAAGWRRTLLSRLERDDAAAPDGAQPVAQAAAEGRYRDA